MAISKDALSCLEVGAPRSLKHLVMGEGSIRVWWMSFRYFHVLSLKFGLARLAVLES